MVEVRELGREGREGGFEEVEVGDAAPGADERTEVEVAPAPTLSHGFGGDWFVIASDRSSAVLRHLTVRDDIVDRCS